MDLALPRFAWLGDGPREVHEPWAISVASPVSPATSRPDTSGEEDRVGLSSPCLNLDGLSSSDDDTGASVGLSDLSVTLLCGSDEVFSPVNSDQVLSDVDFPLEHVSRDKRQVVRMRDVSPDVLLLDASLARRSGDPRRSVARVTSGKRMPEEVSPVPPSVDMTVMCTTGVVPMSTQPPVVTSVPAMSMATVTSREIDVRVGRSDVDPVPRLGLASSSAEERVPAVALSSPPLSGPPVAVLVGESVPAVELSSAVMSEHTVPVPMGECVPAVDSFSTPSSGRSSTPSSRTLAWGDAGDSSVPLSPNCVQAGRSQDVPEEGSLFHVSPISPGFLSQPLREAQPFPLEGVLLPSTMDDFSDSDLGASITYAQCELFPGSVTPMSLPVFSVPSGLASRPDLSSVQTVLALETSSHPEVGSSAFAPSMDMEDSPLLETGLPGWPFRFTPYSGQPFADGNPAFGFAASSPTVPGGRRRGEVGSPLVPLTHVLGRSTWKRSGDGHCCQLATRRGHYVVQSSDTVAVRHVIEPHVI